MFFLHLFSKPLKSTFGANLAPTWCRNDLKKWAWEGPGRHQKLTSAKKLQNLNPTTIYYTWGMSSPSKRHQFRTLKSPKIDEKTRLKKQLLKKDTKRLQITFFSNFDSQLDPLGGSTNSLFQAFFSFGPSWGPNASQDLPQEPPEPTQASIFTDFWSICWYIFGDF